nr:MAG TPA: hypothetical protein [Bacteriophage sp.]
MAITITNSDTVKVEYRKYDSSPIASGIEFELIKDIILRLDYLENEGNIQITMSDAITDNTEISGKLDYDKINVLIRALSQIRNQIKDDKKCI